MLFAPSKTRAPFCSKTLSSAAGRINLHFVLVAGAATLDDSDAQAISVFCSGEKLADLFRGAIGDRYLSNHSSGRYLSIFHQPFLLHDLVLDS